jgi:hypothetical protein
VPEQPSEPAKEKGVHLGLVIAIFLGINLLLGSVGFALWRLLKKRRKTDSAEAEDIKDDEAA